MAKNNPFKKIVPEIPLPEEVKDNLIEGIEAIISETEDSNEDGTSEDVSKN